MQSEKVKILTRISLFFSFSCFFPAYPAGVKRCRCCSSILGRVCRYELPGINAFNFVLEDALGGGGVTSLRSDPQVTLAFCLCCVWGRSRIQSPAELSRKTCPAFAKRTTVPNFSAL